MEFFMIKDKEKLLNEIKGQLDYYENRINQLMESNKKLKDDHYKDLELTRMKEELESMKASFHRGFPISEEEDKAIRAWEDEWFEKKRGGDKYLGAIGGGFTYEFHPTGIGTVGTIIAPDGERFTFRELD